MSDPEPSSEQSGTPTNKVDRLIRRYDLEGIDDELIDKWTTTDNSRLSLRDLAHLFNREVLRAALAEKNVDTIDGEVENIYSLLTDDDVTSGVKTEIRNRLEQDGLDMATTENHFVSHQTIHTYLTKHLGVSQEPRTSSPEELRERELDTIRKLQNRAVAVTENTVKRLKENGGIDVRDPEVIINIQIFCNECGATYSVEQLSTGRSCDCITR